MISPTKIIITLEKKFVDEIDLNGIKLYYDYTYQPEHNVFPYGTVVSVPVHKKQTPILSPEFHHNVEIGDKLYFNYGVVMDEDNCITHDDVNYWLVDYYMALAVVRDGNIIPVGEHILVEPIKEEVKSGSIIIPEMSKHVTVMYGKVAASNDPELPVGAIVHFEEQGMFENTIEGKTLYAMYTGNILAKQI